MQTGQRIGTSVGIAVITAAVFASLEVWSWSTAVIVGFVLIGLVIFMALGVAFKDLRDRSNRGPIHPERLQEPRSVDR